jgi:hypothetical protein
VLARNKFQEAFIMPNIAAVEARIRELGKELDVQCNALENDDITIAEFKTWNAQAEAEIKALRAQRDAYDKAMAWRAVGSPAQASDWANGDSDATPAAPAVRGKKWSPDSPMHFDEAGFKSLFDAGRQRAAGFTAQVDIQTKGVGG